MSARVKDHPRVRMGSRPREKVMVDGHSLTDISRISTTGMSGISNGSEATPDGMPEKDLHHLPLPRRASHPRASKKGHGKKPLSTREPCTPR